jgi:biopolymer transport protein ExbD
MTPMIDVVFLLIIFFLVSSHLAKQENSLPLDLPIAATGLDQSSTPELIVVNVEADGRKLLGSKAVTDASLQQILMQRSKNAPQGIRLKIRTDRSVKYRFVEPILKGAADAGIGDVVYSVFQDIGR